MIDQNTTIENIYTIALDFDGTLVEHKYPEIGAEIPDAVEMVKKLISDGHRLILWTVRERELLDDAIAWCEERGLAFYAINKNYPEETPEDKYFSRKLQADIFIDDRSLGGLPDWPTIYKVISEGKPLEPLYAAKNIVDPAQEEMMRMYQSGGKRRGSIFSRRK